MDFISEISPEEACTIRKVICESDHTPTRGDYFAKHYGYFKETGLVGTVSLYKNNRLRMLCVLPQQQKMGVGSSLINHVLNNLPSGMTWCHVRNSLIPFYQKFGFTKYKTISSNESMMGYLKKI